MTLATTEPGVITSGDTLTFKRSHPDYLPADGWVLSYTLVMAGYQAVFSGTDNGDGSHLINVLTTETSKWPPGEYRWQYCVTKGTDRRTVGEGVMRVRPDFASLTDGCDARSAIKQTLDALEATIQRKASKDQLSYTIAGMTLQRMPATDLIKWHKHYTRLYQQELEADRIARGLPGGRITRVRLPA